MDKLGAFDQVFYKADQYRVTSMIMCGVSIIEPARAGDTLEARAIADHLASRLQKIPLLRMKFVQDPLRIGTVRKVEDPEFDIREHIALRSLPTPGGYKELTRCLADISATPLTPEQLWQFIVIDALEGKKLAVVSRIHHALADGVGIMQALSSINDDKPCRPETLEPDQFHEVENPSAYVLLGEALRESTERLFVKTPRFLFKRSAPVLAAMGRGVKDLLTEQAAAAPDVRNTSLNISESSSRRAIAYKTLSLPEIKSLARAYSTKVNDIGLLLYSFAMQHYFEQIGEHIDFDLWCGMPINTRAPGFVDEGQGGNQVSVGRVNLHNTIADARERLQAISRDSAEAKSQARPEQPLVELQEVADLIFPPILDGFLYLTGKYNLMGRSNEKYAYMNAIMSNVPGPPQTVYIANGAVTENIPMIPIIELVAVSGGFVSLGELITIGFHCHGDTFEDPELFVRGVERGLAELRKPLADSPGKASKMVPDKASKKAPKKAPKKSPKKRGRRPPARKPGKPAAGRAPA